MTTLEKRIIDLSYKYQLSHISSCLNAVPIIDTIYKIKEEDEKFVLSCGHAFLGLAVVLEKYGYGSAEEMWKHHGTHPDRCDKCHTDCSTGSLGMGIGISVGIALADRQKDCYCLVSDGEMAEGIVYEGLRIASEQKLNNLKVVLSYNGFGAYSTMELEPLIARFQAFGWGVLKIDGEVDLESALKADLKDIPIVRVVEADLKEFLFLKGLSAHYHILTEDEYAEIEAKSHSPTAGKVVE